MSSMEELKNRMETEVEQSTYIQLLASTRQIPVKRIRQFANRTTMFGWRPWTTWGGYILPDETTKSLGTALT